MLFNLKTCHKIIHTNPFLFSLFLITGLQSLWTTAICSSNLQQKYPITQPTTSISSDQLLQQSPISDKDVHWDDFKPTKDIHDSANVPLIKDYIDKITDNFYSKSIHHSNHLIANLGNYDADSLPFVAKHRLPKPVM
ncbi:unnamed protein product [Chironomus riparius]|uniref:Uncharacterized protein n=1 Tax=Chironomus riparius TaxID=315576 RepID=A0A9N9RHF5_9DIPT|nr:unnamed protein product [Chironomus riparius]